MTVHEIISKAIREGREFLFEDEAWAVIKTAGIPVIPALPANSEDEAVELAEKLGFPVVLKVRSALITHKTEIGGVKLGLTDGTAVRAAYREILAAAAKTDRQAGIIVQPMARPGVELILGYIRDKQFGPVVIFGLGGTLVELLEDTAFRLAPVEFLEAKKMILQIRGSKLLTGFRGSPPADLEQLQDMIVALGKLGLENPQIEQMDLNPVVARADGALALDSRVKLAK
jgi:acyl-CoA synthetase (NDP forming)